MAISRNFAATYDVKVDGTTGDDDIMLVSNGDGTQNAYVNSVLVGTYSESDVVLLAGGDGNDTLTGDLGNDILQGGKGDDMLIGGNGGDELNGGLGSDTMVGGFGNDIYRVNVETDTILENDGEGTDTVYVNRTNYDMAANLEDAIIVAGSVNVQGNLLDNNIWGSRGDNVLQGNDGNDSLVGGGGMDLLFGGDGNDTLRGGRGMDELQGGLGADTFTFNSVNDTTVGIQNADVITDFSSMESDVIDLLKIDANSTTVESDAFTFIGNAAFSGTAGELRYSFNGTDTIVRGDVDGDGNGDFAIVLTGEHMLTMDDFIL